VDIQILCVYSFLAVCYWGEGGTEGVAKAGRQPLLSVIVMLHLLFKKNSNKKIIQNQKMQPCTTE